MGVGWAHRHTSNRVAAGARSSLHFSRRVRGPRGAPPWNRGSYRDGRTARFKTPPA